MSLTAIDGDNVFLPQKNINVHIEKFWLKISLSALLLIGLTLIAMFTTPDNPISESVFRFFNTYSGGTLWSLLILMEIGSIYVIALLVLTLFALKRWVLGIGIIVAELISLFLANLIKMNITYHRPFLVLDDVEVRTRIAMDIVDLKLNATGFPSGHVAATTVLVILFWPYVTRPIKALLIALLIIVGVGRLYAGVHFPLDVLGGVALGLFAGLLGRQFLVWYSPKGRTTVRFAYLRNATRKNLLKRLR